MTNKREKKKAAKRALKKTARIVFGVIAAIIAVITVVFLVYAIKFFKSGGNTAAAVVLLILAAAGLFADFKITVTIKDSIFAARMDKKYGNKRNAPASLSPEDTKGLSASEIADKICDAYRGESGGNSDADYRITYINQNAGSNGSVKFSVEIEVTVNWAPGADRNDYLNKGRAYASEVESKLRREITSTANRHGLTGVSVTVSSKVS